MSLVFLIGDETESRVLQQLFRKTISAAQTRHGRSQSTLRRGDGKLGAGNILT